MAEIHYQVFGSASSRDDDIMVFVETLDSIQHGKEQCAVLEQTLSALRPEKKVSVNLGVLREGVLIEVFKGLPDECNNSLLATYPLHTQAFPQAILSAVPRDLPAKVARALRVLLSYLSRSPYRDTVKAALRGTLSEKQQALLGIDFTQLEGDQTEFFKTAAFQLGQCVALQEGVEIYTKEALAHYAPELTPYLERTPTRAHLLEQYKNTFLPTFAT